MAEDTQNEGQFRSTEEKESIRAETTSDGRYIPYSGGIMSWHENAGLLKCEAPQNYRFHELVDAESVRRKLFERWGAGENISRRANDRHQLKKPIHLQLTSAGGATVTCTAKDYSSHGLRLHLEGGQHPDFSKGNNIDVVIRESGDSGRTLFKITSQVMWANQVGKNQDTLSIGIAFLDLSADGRQSLLAYLRR